MTRDLTALRSELDRIDRGLIALFEERMAAVAEVAQWKKERGLPVRDAAREAEVLASRRAMLRDPSLGGAAETLFRTLMALARDHETQQMEETDHA